MDYSLFAAQKSAKSAIVRDKQSEVVNLEFCLLQVILPDQGLP